ncbi:hypothetical protein RND81_05G065100 [Saponaria officinalis]|uniref:Uncharacterized protein n=1 Tax=Saponaria officinalis TaxID=3572 RepID=A0AAW1KY49_SAPOF
MVHQQKYIKELLKIFGMEKAKGISTPMATTTKLENDENGTPVDETVCRGMIGSLLYLTASRPDIMQTGYSDADYGGCSIDRKSTSDTATFLGSSIISWGSKKQATLALSTT